MDELINPVTCGMVGIISHTLIHVLGALAIGFGPLAAVKTWVAHCKEEHDS